MRQMLTTHLKNRHGKKTRMKCPSCSCLFTRIDSLHRHFGNIHNNRLRDGTEIEVYRTLKGQWKPSYTKTYHTPRRGSATDSNNPEARSDAPEEQLGGEYATEAYARATEDIRLTVPTELARRITSYQRRELTSDQMQEENFLLDLSYLDEESQRRLMSGQKGTE